MMRRALRRKLLLGAAVWAFALWAVECTGPRECLRGTLQRTDAVGGIRETRFGQHDEQRTVAVYQTEIGTVQVQTVNNAPESALLRVTRGRLTGWPYGAEWASTASCP